MTPATSQNSKTFREQIGPAVWLLALLACSTPADWTGDAPVYVACGNIVADAELAERLGVSQRTIAKWRCRLRAVGVIGWLVAPGKGRQFWIADVNRVLGVHGETTAERKPAEEPVKANAETALTAPVMSRWVQ